MDDTVMLFRQEVSPLTADGDAGEHARDWLLLIHQLPAEPAYLRVRILRRLKGAGAVALKNSVYLLPDSAAAREDFHWIRREAVDGGGEATLSAVRFLEGISRGQLEALFRSERDIEYAEVAAAARAAAEGEPTGSEVDRLRRRLNAVIERDYFQASGRIAAEHALRAVEERISGVRTEYGGAIAQKPQGATWVTREGVFIDRIASAWLIRRFIDPMAQLKFVQPDGYVQEEGEIRFDMFESEFTHEGERCTFETLLARFGLGEPALVPIAEIVHDIDCKDEKYGRPETAGVASVVRGIAAGYDRDEDRVSAASHVFDGLLARFRADPM